MSKWGYVDAATARRKFESSPEEAGEMVREMAKLIIDQEKAIGDLKDSLTEAQRNEGLARAAEAHIGGIYPVSPRSGPEAEGEEAMTPRIPESDCWEDYAEECPHCGKPVLRRMEHHVGADMIDPGWWTCDKAEDEPIEEED